MGKNKTVKTVLFKIDTLKLKALSKITSVFLCTSLIFPSIAQAHSGRTNSAGCHRRTSNGTTHCHNSGSSSSSDSDSGSSDSALYILGGVVVVSAITYFVVKSSRKNKYRSSRSSRKKYSSTKKPNNYKRNSNRRSNRSGGGYPSIDLKLASSVSNSNPVDGELITIELLLLNEKSTRASGVMVLTNLPSNLSFSSASSENGEYDSSTGIWSIGDVDNFATRKLTIRARYKADASATFKSEIYSANERDIDSTPNNNNSIEDDQTSVVVNDYSNNKINSDKEMSLYDLDYFNTFIADDKDTNVNKQISINQLAMMQVIEAMQYKPAFSLKSIGFQKDDYHLELQYKF